jgi:multimeric flavodoxin WrbA
MKLIGILGSPRRDGNTAYLLEETLKDLKDKVKTEIFFLKDYEIKPCDGCHYCEERGKCKIEDDMQKLYQMLEESDIIILASPSYMGGITSRMRAFMERTWFLRKGQLKYKVGTWIVVGRRSTGSTVNEMNEYLDRLGVIKLPGIVGYAFKKGDILKDKEAIRETKRLSNDILNLIKNRR